MTEVGKVFTRSGAYANTRARPVTPTHWRSAATNFAGMFAATSFGSVVNNPACEIAPSDPASWDKNRSAGELLPSSRICAESSAESP